MVVATPCWPWHSLLLVGYLHVQVHYVNDIERGHVWEEVPRRTAL